MQVIGVVDVLGGQAVHACAGHRERYVPVESVAGFPIPRGDALALARAYVERLGLSELYAADLDAILGRIPQDAVAAQLAAVGPPLWLDAGVSSTAAALRAVGLSAARVIVGLETLPSFDMLRLICEAVGGDRVAFSLDLRAGAPIVAHGDIPQDEPAHRLASRAADMGVGAVIVIDLARVGTGSGLDIELISRLRAAAPRPMILAGGGVRGFEDLSRLADAGCDGALVGTALHDGRLGSDEIAAARQLDRPRPGGARD